MAVVHRVDQRVGRDVLKLRFSRNDGDACRGKRVLLGGVWQAQLVIDLADEPHGEQRTAHRVAVPPVDLRFVKLPECV
jgi:hypothetical protein